MELRKSMNTFDVLNFVRYTSHLPAADETKHLKVAGKEIKSIFAKQVVITNCVIALLAYAHRRNYLQPTFSARGYSKVGAVHLFGSLVSLWIAT